MIVVDGRRCTFQFETYPNEAPKSVEHILGLVKELRQRDAHPPADLGFIAQFGDLLSRDLSKQESGTGGSFNIVGVGEPNQSGRTCWARVAMAYPARIRASRQPDSAMA